ncbi:MAG: hypothetical protein LBE59_02075 [Nevskiaceae bacterium]|jgi:division protein CdvB (Snf7/Vps24/ESCRT-III family)|nr:hypothetical protein [Nevskiaceae bacterium]
MNTPRKLPEPIRNALSMRQRELRQVIALLTAMQEASEQLTSAMDTYDALGGVMVLAEGVHARLDADVLWGSREAAGD